MKLKPSTGQHHQALALVCVLAGILIPLSILFFDAPQRDECYQALSVLNYRRSPLAPLTFFNGYIWFKAFGETVLSLRVLNLLCHTISIGIGCLYFLHRSDNSLRATVMFMALTTASQVWAMHIYNWDTGCYPFAMLCLMAAIAFWQRPAWQRTLWLALAAAALSASRLPAAVCIPLLTIAVGIRLRHAFSQRGLWHMLFFLTVSTLATAAIIIAIYGGITGVKEAFSPQNIISGHGVESLIRYIDRIKVITPQLATEAILPLYMMVCTYILVKLRTHRKLTIATMIMIMEMIIAAILFIVPIRTFFALLLLPFLLLWAYPTLTALRHTGRFGKISSTGWLAFMIMCVPIVGSDGFQERFMVLPTLPVVAALVYPEIKRYIDIFFMACFVAAASMVGVKDLYYISCGINMIGNDVPAMRGLVFDNENYLSIQQQKAAITELKAEGKRIAVIGDGRYPSSLAFGTDQLIDLHAYHSKTLADDMPDFLQKLPHYDAIMVFNPVYYANDAITSEVNSTDNDNFERFIISQGFNRSPTDYFNFSIYVRGE